MGKKITDYVNNVSVTPDELSLLDVSEKTGLATYESRKWTLQQFKAWINANLSIPSVDGTQGQIPLFVQDDVIGSNTRFTFIDNQGTEVGFRFSDSAGNLTQVGVTYLNVESQGIASNSALRLANWSDNSNKGIVTFRKSRGDKATPLKVLNEDILGTLIFTGQADKTIYDGFGYTTFPAGMTTAEIIIRAKSDYQRDYNALINETQAQALTQYEIWLQEQDSSCGGDFTPANIKVFSVDGNGLVSFKNYRFPTYDGTPNQVLKTDGAGNLSWTDQSGGLNGTLFSVPRFTSNNTLVDSGLNDNGSGMYNEYGTLEFTHSSGYFRVSSLVQTEESFSFNPGGNYVLQYQSDEARAVYLTYGGANPVGPGGILIYRQTPPVSGTTYWCFGHSVAKNIICVTTEQHATSGGFDNLGQYGQELRLGGVPNGSSIMNKTIILTQDNKLKVSNAYTLPNTDGTANQVLVTDGLGNVSWGSSSGSGITGSGQDGRVTFWSGNTSITSSEYMRYVENGIGLFGYGTFIVDSAQNMGTSTEIALGKISTVVSQNQNNYKASLSLTTQSTGNVYSSVDLIFSKFASPAFPSLNDILGEITFQSAGGKNGYIRVKANEQHTSFSKGGRMEFTVRRNGVNNTDIISLMLDGDGSVKISDAYKLPLTDGTSNQLLATNGAGQLSFVNNLSPITQDKWALPNSAQLRGFLWSPNSTSRNTFGQDAGAVTGTTTSTAKTPASGSELSKKISCKLGVSTPVANGLCGYRGTATNYFRDNGILFSCAFGISDTAYNDTAMTFCGLSSLVTLTLTSTAPSTVGNQLWNSLNFIGVGNDSYASSFSGSATGTTLTVTAIAYGAIEIGQSFSASATGTKILSQISGTPGGIGTYQISISQTITQQSGLRSFDINLVIACNDGAGNATKIQLGDNFPANRTSATANTNNFYVFELYNGIDSSEISWRIKNTGIPGSVQEGTITTNLPLVTTPLNHQIMRTSGAQSNACSFDISHLYCSNLS